MLDLWREVGFAGFGDGLLWVCDPYYWQPIVDTWLRGVDLPAEYHGNQIPLFRTAYGKIYCFKPGLGQKMEIDPVLCNVALFHPETIAGQEWIDMGISDVLGFPPTQYVVHADSPTDGDDLQEDLFARIVDQLGPLSHDTIYAFAPSAKEGGDIRAEQAVVAVAATELTRLRSLGAPETSMD